MIILTGSVTGTLMVSRLTVEYFLNAVVISATPKLSKRLAALCDANDHGSITAVADLGETIVVRKYSIEIPEEERFPVCAKPFSDREVNRETVELGTSYIVGPFAL